MAILSDRDREIIRNRFETELVDDVKLVFFTKGEAAPVSPDEECPECKEEHQLLDELVAISPKLHLEVHDLLVDRAAAQDYQIEEVPALVLARDGNKGVRFYGLTSGYEFAALIEDIIDVGKGQSALSSHTQQALAQVTEPLRIRVFVTPT